MRWPPPADGADALICLGDLLLFVDYADHRQGIFPDLFGAEAARQFIELRTAQRFDEARALSAQLWAGLGGDPRPARRGRGVAAVRGAVRGAADAGLPDLRQRRHSAACGPRTCGRATACSTASGSSSAAGRSASSAAACARRTGRRMRSTTRPTRPRWTRSAQVDVLCAHIPPAVPELLFDTVAQRMERGSEALLDAIRRTQPRYVLFGHVHQPLASRVADRPHRVHQRRPLPRHRDALRAGLVAWPIARWRYAPSMADRTTSSITIALPRAAVMAVIADFAAYPEWATGVRGRRDRGLARTAGPSRVRFTLDAGVIRDSYVLAYDWDGDARVRWDLAEPGSVISELSGGYLLADRGRRYRGDLRARGGRPDPDAGDAQAQGGEDDHRHRAEGPQETGRSIGRARRARTRSRLRQRHRTRSAISSGG